MPMNRRHFLALSCVAPLFPAQSVRAAATSTFGGHAFGSYWRITCREGSSTDRLRARIATIIASVDAAMSPYRPDSEIARFNASRSTDWLAVSPHTQTVVAAALHAARRCHGSFDPTVGPLVGRYGFGPIGGSRHGNHRHLAVRAGAIRKDDAGLTLDLCGIAKGHALDRMVVALDALGITDYLIELGGEVFARGRHPAGRRWQVAVEDPRVESNALAHLVTLDAQAIATSGNKVNGYALSGHRYGHIIDPLTQSATATNLLSVSVMANVAMLADALATGMMAMGLERAGAFAHSEGMDALLLARDGTGLKSFPFGRFAGRMLS